MNTSKRSNVIEFPLERSRLLPPRRRTVHARDGKFVFAAAPASSVTIEEALERITERTSRFNARLLGPKR